MNAIPKDPGAKLDYGFRWAQWLEAGELITAAQWTVPEGLTNELEEFSETITKVWLSGGTAGTDYTISCQITTSKGRIEERAMIIQVQER